MAAEVLHSKQKYIVSNQLKASKWTKVREGDLHFVSNNPETRHHDIKFGFVHQQFNAELGSIADMLITLQENPRELSRAALEPFNRIDGSD